MTTHAGSVTYQTPIANGPGEPVDLRLTCGGCQAEYPLRVDRREPVPAPGYCPACYLDSGSRITLQLPDPTRRR